MDGNAVIIEWWTSVAAGEATVYTELTAQGHIKNSLISVYGGSCGEPTGCSESTSNDEYYLQSRFLLQCTKSVTVTSEHYASWDLESQTEHSSDSGSCSQFE